MVWWTAFLMFIPSFIVVLLTGMPIAFGFFLINIIGVSIFMGGAQGMNQLILSTYDSLAKFSLAPVPLFVLMGEILFRTKLAKRILDVLSDWFGSIPGRLSVITIFAGMIFGALSGSNMANTALLGSVLAPEMKDRGYHKDMIAGPILASGGLAMIIPPSSLSVIYASIAKVSVAKILIAGILPGVLMGMNYIIYTVIRCKINPSLAPQYKTKRKPIKEKAQDFISIVLPTGTLIFLVTGSIFFGIATPTEASALGALGAIIIAICYKEFSIDLLSKSLRETVKITTMVFLIVSGAAAFSQLLSFSGATRGLVYLILSLNVPKTIIITLMLLVVVFLGTFMDQIPIMMVCVPLYMPIITEFDVNIFWFSILFLIALEIGLTTPPFGVNLFVMKGVSSEDVTMVDLYSAAFPYVLCDVTSMVIVAMIPAIATWLPSLL